jgi:hypothetical protein
MKPLQNHKNKKYVPETTGQYKKSREAVIESLGIFLLSARLHVDYRQRVLFAFGLC